MELDRNARAIQQPVEVVLDPDPAGDESSKVVAFLAGGVVIAGAMFGFLYLGQSDRDEGLTTGSIGRIEAPGSAPSPTLRLQQRS